jgi:NADPH-dependent glutamate synthase beta subunit-like oxidoreductase/glutamate synthase domain-containing protein 3/ferredoxin
MFVKAVQVRRRWKADMYKVIVGNKKGVRISSKALDEEIREAVRQGARELNVIADGQQGIGGRIWGIDGKISIVVEGPVGQRLGGMGTSGTEIIVKGSVSDDVGWLNCGARITVLGDVTNGAHNAAAQGILYVQGSGGGRCDTITKCNPSFEPPQSWYFRDVGDAFAEFKTGGISVVCGVNPRNKKNILGYRPCVGMVGGIVYFRGPIEGFSKEDVKLVDLSAQDWQWLIANIKPFLESIHRMDYYGELTRSSGEWKKLIPYTAQERARQEDFPVSMEEFRSSYWEANVGKGGIFSEYVDHPADILPYITTGADRRYKPVWNNGKYAPPCEYACPSGIPTWKRTQLIRAGKLQEALELVLQYSPLPATVCGEICAHLCMDGCTRSIIDRPLNTEVLGKESLALKAPPLPEKKNGRKVAVIGGGAGGLSAAWQLALKGYDVNLYEAEKSIGGKLEYFIPQNRLPRRILKKELERFENIGVHIHTGISVNRQIFDEIYRDHDAVIVACGTHKPKKIPVKGIEDMLVAYNFLKDINIGRKPDLSGQDIIIIGAGNVGMDVAAQAYQCGAERVTAIDVQKPAAFGKELEIARSLGTQIVWPKFISKYDRKNRTLYFTDDTLLHADSVVLAIGDTPVTDFLPITVHTNADGWIEADEAGRTSDPKVFAVGDAVSPGLVTHAIGHGKRAAEAVQTLLSGIPYDRPEPGPVIPKNRVKTAYYEHCRSEPVTLESEADRCLSCGRCRDCHMCEITCYYGAIKRKEDKDGTYEYIVDDGLCIGCGFCAGVCPCGIWEMITA